MELMEINLSWLAALAILALLGLLLILPEIGLVSDDDETVD
jgi:hypothetical protein